jgi:hypothetical protein
MNPRFRIAKIRVPSPLQSRAESNLFARLYSYFRGPVPAIWVSKLSFRSWSSAAAYFFSEVVNSSFGLNTRFETWRREGSCGPTLSGLASISYHDVYLIFLPLLWLGSRFLGECNLNDQSAWKLIKGLGTLRRTFSCALSCVVLCFEPRSSEG